MAARDRIVELRRVKAGDLAPHESNPRLHPEAQRRAVEGSLATLGQVAPLLAFWEGDRLRLFDGHLRRAIDPEAEVTVAVTDLTPAEARQALATLDRSGALADTDEALLSDLLRQVREDAAAGVLAADARLDGLLADLTRPPLLTDPDTLPEQVPPRAKRGDLWLCGAHRVMCGDATCADDVARVMEGAEVHALITDPPYNVGEDYDGATDDAKTAEDYARFTAEWWSLVPCALRIVTPGCYNLASWCRWFDPYHVAPWTKTNSMTNGKSSRFWCWEPILFYGRPPRLRPNDVFDFPIGMQSEVGDHPCPKPAALWSELFECYTAPGAAVYDPFVGAGTGLIAAEGTGRLCVAMDHSPHYIDIALARWEAATGRAAILGNARDE